MAVNGVLMSWPYQWPVCILSSSLMARRDINRAVDAPCKHFSHFPVWGLHFNHHTDWAHNLIGSRWTTLANVASDYVLHNRLM